MARPADERRQLTVSTTVRDVRGKSPRVGDVLREIFKSREPGGENALTATRLGGDFWCSNRDEYHRRRRSVGEDGV